MPTEIFASPTRPEADTNTVPAGSSWVDGAWAQIAMVIRSGWLIYAVAGLLAALLLLSLVIRRKRDETTDTKRKSELTWTDRAVTRITGVIATAVVATGAWKVFGDVLDLHWSLRLVLFFFAEAQIIALWRQVRRHIYRHASLGARILGIYGIAFGSAAVAIFDADNPVEIALRLFAAGVAAFMIAAELAEELDIHLTANPHLRPDGKPKRGLFGIKWSISAERIMVWLRLAEPTERTVEQVERQRRIARFARTGYRLQLLKEAGAAKWRIGYARWSLRRQTEAGNEHLNLASDKDALSEVRSHLALLYGAEAGTSRNAVSDLNPLTPAPRRALSDKPHVSTADTQRASQDTRTDVITREVRSEGEGSHPNTQEPSLREKPTANAPEIAAETPAEKPAEKVTASPTKPAGKPAHPLADHDNPSVRKLAKAFARKPGGTNPELAKLARVSDGTANRYMAQVRAAFKAAGESPEGSQEQAQKPLIPPTFDIPKTDTPVAVNGRHPSFEETT